MRPARQRFEPGDFTGLQIDQWLVEQVELVLIERAAKLGLDREAAPRLGRLPWLIDLRAAGDLGLLDRELGVAEQLLRVLAGVHQGDSDAAFDADLEVGDLERRAHHLVDPVGGLERVLDAAAERHQDSELVAAGAGEDIACPEREDQPPREGDQQLVAGEAAHRFIDPREAQHVDDEHRMVEVARRRFAGFLDRFAEAEAVGQAGQAVAQHLGAKVVLGLDLDRPVDDAEQAARRVRRVQRRAATSLSFRKRRPTPSPSANLDLVPGAARILEESPGEEAAFAGWSNA